MKTLILATNTRDNRLRSSIYQFVVAIPHVGSRFSPFVNCFDVYEVGDYNYDRRRKLERFHISFPTLEDEILDTA